MALTTAHSPQKLLSLKSLPLLVKSASPRVALSGVPASSSVFFALHVSSSFLPSSSDGVLLPCTTLVSQHVENGPNPESPKARAPEFHEASPVFLQN